MWAGIVAPSGVNVTSVVSFPQKNEFDVKFAIDERFKIALDRGDRISIGLVVVGGERMSVGLDVVGVDAIMFVYFNNINNDSIIKKTKKN